MLIENLKERGGGVLKLFMFVGDRKSQVEIRARIGIAKPAFNKRKILLPETLSKIIEKK